MKIEDKLTASVINGVKELYGAEVPAKMVQLQKTKKEFEGHLTLVVFPFLKMSKKGPEQTAQEIGEYLKQHEPAIANYNVIKGFLINHSTWDMSAITCWVMRLPTLWLPTETRL